MRCLRRGASVLESCSSALRRCIRTFRSEREEKRGALFRKRLRPDGPSVLANDAADDCESHARTLEILGAMQSLENAEKLVDVLHVEAYAVVANVDHRNPIGYDLADLDHRVLAPPGVFQ